MIEQWFSVELLSDVVVTADAATAGGHTGLDYLPGSLFLGAAVSQAEPSFNPQWFLSGQLRFLDGFPAVQSKASAMQPTMPIPLAYHTVKGQEWKGLQPLNLLTKTDMEPGKQPQQLRTGFMTVDGGVVEIEHTYHMKTAIDPASRRAKDGQLFGYQSIPAGVFYLTRIQADDAALLAQATAWLTGHVLHVGRSRSAEYGAIRMTAITPPAPSPVPQDRGNEVVCYLLSDLALVRDGMPVLQPEAADFHLPAGAQLVPEKCFLRTRRYTPWNGFFDARMSERQVLCKGGVITFHVPEIGVIDLSGIQANLAKGIGLYREEGLGQVLMNPTWLMDAPVLSVAKHARSSREASRPASALISYLETKTERQAITVSAMKAGVAWAIEWKRLSDAITKMHGKAPGKTQWSTIREIAIRCIDSPENLVERINEYCTDALRRKIWVEASVRRGGCSQNLYGVIKDTIKAQQGMHTCLSLYYAAVEMGNLLGRR